MRSCLIVVPYLLGVEGASMGAGPLALQDAVAEVLRPGQVERLKLDDDEGTEVGRCFELNRRLAVAVADARAAGEVPVVLTGNCHSSRRSSPAWRATASAWSGSTATRTTTRRTPPRAASSTPSGSR